MKSKKLKLSKIFTISLRSTAKLFGLCAGDYFEIKSIDMESGEIVLKARKINQGL